MGSVLRYRSHLTSFTSWSLHRLFCKISPPQIARTNLALSISISWISRDPNGPPFEALSCKLISRQPNLLFKSFQLISVLTFLPCTVLQTYIILARLQADLNCIWPLFQADWPIAPARRPWPWPDLICKLIVLLQATLFCKLTSAADWSLKLTTWKHFEKKLRAWKQRAAKHCVAIPHWYKSSDTYTLTPHSGDLFESRIHSRRT